MNENIPVILSSITNPWIGLKLLVPYFKMPPCKHHSQIVTWRPFMSNELQCIARPYNCHSPRPWNSPSDPPKPELRVENLIKVFWLGKLLLTNTGLKPFLRVRIYKAQESTLNAAVFDLKDDSTAKGQNEHKKFCSMYVQLSRLQSLDGLHLL